MATVAPKPSGEKELPKLPNDPQIIRELVERHRWRDAVKEWFSGEKKGVKAKDNSEVVAGNTSISGGSTEQDATMRRSGSERWSSITKKSKEKTKEIGKQLHLPTSRSKKPENYHEMEWWMCTHSGGTVKEKPRSSWP
ncbi:Xenotropic and polytropic retrovirus receptor 1 [Hypoxylon texense]